MSCAWCLDVPPEKGHQWWAEFSWVMVWNVSVWLAVILWNEDEVTGGAPLRASGGNSVLIIIKSYAMGMNDITWESQMSHGKSVDHSQSQVEFWRGEEEWDDRVRWGWTNKKRNQPLDGQLLIDWKWRGEKCVVSRRRRLWVLFACGSIFGQSILCASFER